jgi:hypothetical protein
VADNIELDAGSGGATVATDDDGTAHHQYVKLEAGADGTQTKILAGGGVESGALRVTIASDSTGVVSIDDGGGNISIDDGGNTITVDGTVTANLGATDTAALAAIETAVEGTLTVDSELTTADLDTGAGTDTRAVVGLAGTASGGAQLIPGSSTDGLLVNLGSNNDVTVSGVATAANQTTVIGHLDGVEGLLTTIDGDTSNLSVVGGGTEAAAIRVTVANNSTGVLSVDDNGSTLSIDDGGAAITVDGTVTAELSAVDNAVLDNIDADLTTIIGHVDGVEALLTTIDADTSNLSVVGSGTEAAAIRVTVATDSTGVLSVDDNGSTISVDDGGGVLTVDGTVTANLAAGTNNIGDVDVLTIAAGTNAIGNVGIVPRTTGGYTIFRSIDLDETEEEIKATAGQVFGWYIFNAAATTHYVKFYNATAANVTVGSTTPVMTIPVPAGSAANVFTDTGIAFGTAITAAATTGVADADTGAPAANAVVVNILYA